MSTFPLNNVFLGYLYIYESHLACTCFPSNGAVLHVSPVMDCPNSKLFSRVFQVFIFLWLNIFCAALLFTCFSAMAIFFSHCPFSCAFNFVTHYNQLPVRNRN